MLRKRLLAAVLGLPMLFVLVWLNCFLRQHGSHDDLILLFLVVLIAGVSGWEVSHIVQGRYPHTAPWNGVYAAVILPFLIHSIRPVFAGGGHIGGLGLLIDSLGATTAVMLLFLAVWGDIEQRRRDGIMENLYVIAAALYLGITTSFLLLLTFLPFHELAIVLVFVAIFTLDTAAYFGGKHFGGAHIAPKISPRKTWSGSIIGFLATAAICTLFTFIPGAGGDARLGVQVPWWGFTLIGASVGVVGQLGDLLESAFKRWGGVKDSGVALPGHGGFLDRFDSLFLAAPVVYLLLRLFMS